MLDFVKILIYKVKSLRYEDINYVTFVLVRF